MICAACGETTSQDPCTHCGKSPLLEGRYRLERLLGQGAIGTTYAATRLTDGTTVAVKEMPLRRAETQKSRELLDREIGLLRQLDHASIPHHVEDFRAGSGKHRALYLVQEYIEGASLAVALEDHRFQEDEVCGILDMLLEILVYLHGLRPPVIHRDIKPSNVMRRPDGRLVLIDFGAARDAIEDPDLGGSTVAGTFGYMAPEQYQGDATPRTDLYALGMLAAALLTRKEPRELLSLGPLTHALDAAHTSLPLRQFLDALTAEDPSYRPGSAQAARDMLRALRASPVPSAPAFPAESSPVEEPVVVRQTYHHAPLEQTSGETGRLVAIFATVGLSMLAVWALTMTVEQPKGLPEPLEEVRQNPPPRCAGGPCRPLGEGQLKGVELGMTRSLATEAFPELAKAEDQLAERILPDDVIMDVSYLMDRENTRVEVPGASLALTTTLFKQPARCSFLFAVDDRVSSMHCELTRSSASSDAHSRLTRVFRDRLATQYGPPTAVLGGVEDAVYSWDDATGSLELTSDYTSFTGLMASSKLEVSFVSAEHESLLEKLKAEANKAYASDRRRRERTELREIQRMKEELADPSAGGDL